MARIVQKYGGTSVGDVDRIKHVAGRIKAIRDAGNELVVVVSARASGKSLTTSVFTDRQGNYAFPSLDAGQYRVWAQAVGFEAAR